MRPASPRRPSSPKAARLNKLDNPRNPDRAAVAGVGADDANLRFKVQGSRFPVLRFRVLPVLRFKVRNRMFRTPKGLLLSKILENQRMRTVNLEP